MSDYRKLNQQPLVLVLMEIQYSPILMLAKYIPDLHDRLRHLYPNVIPTKDRAVKVNNDGIEVAEIERWVFTSKQGNCIVDIDQNRIVFATTQYDRFGGFEEQVREIILVLKEIVNPSFFTRVGLRYCDNVVSINNNEAELAQMLKPQFLFDNSLSKLGGKGLKRQEILIPTGETHLLIRTMQSITNAIVPDDLKVLGLKLPIDESPKLRVMLDFDHFWQDTNQPKDFEVEGVIETLESLHELSRKAFWEVTTEYARDNIWN